MCHIVTRSIRCYGGIKWGKDLHEAFLEFWQSKEVDYVRSSTSRTNQLKMHEKQRIVMLTLPGGAIRSSFRSNLPFP